MSIKNPFEVRLEILKMAQEMLRESYNETASMSWEMISKVAEYQHKPIQELKDYFEALKPVMYTPADVLKKASELYEFVTKKD